MIERDVTMAFVVDGRPLEVFKAINDIRGWWSGEIVGSHDKINDEFTYRLDPYHASTQRIIDLVPGRRITWRVVASHLTFVEDPSEWDGTTMEFDLVPRRHGTLVLFTHRGLDRTHQSFDAWSSIWRSLFENGLQKQFGHKRNVA